MKTNRKFKIVTSVLFFCALVFFLSFGTADAAILKGIIGVHSTYSDGSNTVAELCTKAKQLGYDYLIFTERYEDMNSTKWSQLVTACDGQTGSGFYAIPGLDMPSLYSGKVIRSFAFNPNAFPTATELVTLRFTYSQNSFTPVVTTPNKNGIDIHRMAFWYSMEMFSYREGALYDDASELYEDLVINKVYFSPISGHRIYSTTDLEGLDNDYITYFRNSVLSQNCFVSNGPVINDFYIDSPGTWFSMGDQDKYTINIDVSSSANITNIQLFRDGQLYRTYHPNSTTFTESFSWYPVEGCRFYFVAEDANGKKVYSNYLYFQSYPYAHVMCMDNQNNIPVWMLNDPLGIDDIVNFGAAHWYSHNVRYFCDRPSGELVPPGTETGVAGAIYYFAAYHKLGSETDWTAYDKIAFYMKSDHVGITGAPRWMNNNVWNSHMALAVTTTDTNWHYYEVDISTTGRDSVSDFLFYIPSTGYDFKVWLDDLKLIDSSTSDTKTLDNFEDGVNLWLTGAPDNYIWSSTDAQEGTQSMLVDVQRTDAVSSNAVSFLGIGNFPIHKFEMPLSGKECAAWNYYGENDEMIQNATYYLFLPPLYKYNAVLLHVETQFKTPPSLDYTVSPGQFGLGLSQAAVQASLGEWPNFAYLDTEGSLVTGTFASTSPEAVPILNQGFVASYPNEYGSYAYMPIEDRPYAFSGADGNLRIGYVDKPTDYIEGDTLTSDFLFLLDAGSDFFTQPAAFQTFRDVYGFDGSTAYTKSITKGTLVDDVYALQLEASDYEARGTLGSATLPNNLPVMVEGLNENWDTVAYNKTTGEFKRVPVMDGKALVVWDVASGADFIVGNLVKSNNVNLIINTVKNSDTELLVQVHNPTGETVSTHLTSPASIYNGIVISRDMTLDPYSTSTFTVDLATFNTLILNGPAEGTTLDVNTATFTYSANKPIQEYYYRLIGYEGSYTSTTATAKTYTDLPDGTYTFSVYARDEFGTLETTPDERTFTVDFTELDTTILTGPSSPWLDSNVEFTFTANKDVKCFYYKLWPIETVYSKTTLTRKYYNNLADGNYQFIMFSRGTDDTLETTPARWTFSVDVPDDEINTRITSGPDYVDHDSDVDFTYEANMPVKAFYYRLYGLEDSYTKTTGTTTSYTSLADGDYQFIVFARAADDTLESTAARWSFKVLNEIDTTITDGPSSPDADGNVSFTWEADRPAQQYYYRLWPVEGGYTSTTETSKSYTGLADGDYEFIVMARDTDGYLETTPERWWFNVTVAPGMTASPPTASESAAEPTSETMLIELYPNEQVSEQAISLFKNVPFTLTEDAAVNIEVVATCASGENDDDLAVVLRGSDTAATIMTFNGDTTSGAICGKLTQANLAAGDYTLEFYAEGAPTLNTVKVSTEPLTERLDAQIAEVAAGDGIRVFKEFTFNGVGDLVAQIVARTNTSADADDDVVVYVDGASFGMNTVNSIDGDVEDGAIRALDVPLTKLAEGTHTITLVVDGTPTVYTVRVLEPENRTLVKIVADELVKGGESQDVTFTLSDSALITISLNLSAEAQSAKDDVALALDGKSLNDTVSVTKTETGVLLTTTVQCARGTHTLTIAPAPTTMVKSLCITEVKQ